MFLCTLPVVYTTRFGADFLHEVVRVVVVDRIRLLRERPTVNRRDGRLPRFALDIL